MQRWLIQVDFLEFLTRQRKETDLLCGARCYKADCEADELKKE